MFQVEVQAIVYGDSMAFIINTTNFLDQNGLNLVNTPGSGRPSSPVNGQIIFNTSTNMLEIFENGWWKDVLQNQDTRGFLFRTVITAGYIAGGYKNSSPWRNVNRMNHATDIMTNLGDLLSIAANYTSGVNSLTRAYMWGAGPNWDSATVTTVAYNMNTETTAGTQTSWNMSVARNDCGTIFKETQYAYVTGGGSSTVDVWTISTETFSAGGVSGMTGDASYQYGVTAWSDETVGYWWGSGGQKVTFASGTSYTVATAGGVNVNGQQKGISSKLGRGYFGNEGTYSGGYNLRRYVSATDQYYTVSKPIGDCGEENFDMGQNFQYMYGQHDSGGQNNRGWKFNYSSDSGWELGSGSIRTGVPGGSSGHCAWKG